MNEMRAERSASWRVIAINTCLTAVLWATCTGCGGGTTGGSRSPADDSTDTADSRRILDEIKGLYEKARSTDGSRVPGDIVEWLKADVQKMGTWEYKVVKIVEPGEQVGGESVESQLTRLGAEKWECFWMERRDAGPLYAYMKRRHRSYVETVPLNELIDMLRNNEGK